MAMVCIAGLGPLTVQLLEKIKWLAVPAVDVFFVLSGFCLMYSLDRTDLSVLSISQFVVKRVLRIYPAYLAAMCVAYLGKQLFYEQSSVLAMSPWFHSFWVDDPTAQDIVDHFVLVLPFDYSKLNPVVWTLSVEMRMSLLFPIMAWTLKMRLKAAGGLILAVICLSILVFHVDYLAYLPLFALGATAAKYRDGIARRMPSSLWISLPILAVPGVLVVLVRSIYPEIMADVNLIHIIIGFIGTYFILVSTVQAKLNGLLRTVPALFLGRISYSFYLLHLPVLLSSAMLLARHVPILVIWAVGLFCSIMLAWVCYHRIEIPSLHLGRQLSGRIEALVGTREAAC